MRFFRIRRPLPGRFTILSAGLVGLLLSFTFLIANGAVRASSHREAPLISQDAFADNTDTYVFIPPGAPDRLVLMANWIPFEGPEGGPNYFEWGRDVLYDIHVDTNGDAIADVTYTLDSRVEVGNGETFLYNTAPIDALADPDWNRRQYVTITETFKSGSAPSGVSLTNVIVDDALTVPAHIGNKSTPRYRQDLFPEAIRAFTDPYNGDEIAIFAGQADDPFFVDLQIFDLLTLRGQAPPIGYAKQPNGPVDSVAGFNVHSMVIELPISRLTVAYGDPVVGVWATARRATTTVLGGGGAASSGPAVQVSRLGMPLTNEVVVPLALKDLFNSLQPADDLGAYLSVPLLQKSVEDPEVGRLLCALYGVPLPGDGDDDCSTEVTVGAPRSGRGDIFDIFLTGMILAKPFTIETADGPLTLPAGFNVNQPANVVPADMLRINTAISGDLCAPTPSPLGLLGGDACGFPNGRRLTDDAVDIEVLAVAGAAYEVLDDRDATFSFNPALVDILTDGVDQNDRPFQSDFPYISWAQSGQRHRHTNAGFFFTAAGLLGLAPAVFLWRRRRRPAALRV